MTNAAVPVFTQNTSRLPLVELKPLPLDFVVGSIARLSTICFVSLGTVTIQSLL